MKNTTPHSLDAEKGMLSSIMQNIKLVDEHSDKLKPALFFHPAHRAIFMVIMDAWSEGVDCDIITITERLATSNKLDGIGGPAYVAEVFSFVPTWRNHEQYLEILRDKNTARLTISVAEKLISSAQDPASGGELSEAVQKALVSVAADAESSSVIQSVGQAALRRVDEYEEIVKNKGKLLGITTGLKPLDQLTGGMRPSQLIVIGAPTKGGKTALALNIAMRTADAGNGVGIISLEMSSGELIDRLVASCAGADISVLSKDPQKQDIDRIRHGITQISKLPIWIRDESSINPLQLRAAIRRMVATHNIKLIILDYIQLCEPSNLKDSRERQVAEISRTLKQVAKELGITIIALTQLNRAGTSRESDAIMHDCDSFWVIRYDEENRKWSLDIRLARAHARGSIPLEFRSQYLRFDEGQPNQ